MRNIIAIIPARGGSKGLKNKNILDLNGKPLLEWSIQFARENEFINECILSTDSEEIAGIGEKCGASVPFLREKSLATDSSKTSDVIIDVINKCNLDKKDLFVLLEPTSPFRLHRTFEKLLKYFDKNKFKKIVSVQECVSTSYRFQFFINDTGELVPLNRSNLPNDLRRQDIKKTFYLDGSFYLSYISEFVNYPGFYGEGTGSFINDYFSSFEIDSLEDLQLMQSIFSNIGAPF